MARVSNCSSKVPVDLYWRDLLSVHAEEHFAKLVEEVFKSLDSEGRVWNVYTETDARMFIEELLELASKGELIPIDHVKSLRSGVGDLYEIRFQDIATKEIRETASGKKVAVTNRTNARLIHVEPMRISLGAIGISAFEKPNTSDAKDIQEREIGLAISLEAGLRKDNWGIVQRRK